jgi:hypothetical protein
MTYLAGVVPIPEMYYHVRGSDVKSTNQILVNCHSRVHNLTLNLCESTHNAFPVFGKKRVSLVEKSLPDTSSLLDSVSDDLDSSEGGSIDISADSYGDHRKNPDGISTLCEEQKETSVAKALSHQALGERICRSIGSISHLDVASCGSRCSRGHKQRQV